MDAMEGSSRHFCEEEDYESMVSLGGDSMEDGETSGQESFEESYGDQEEELDSILGPEDEEEPLRDDTDSYSECILSF